MLCGARLAAERADIELVVADTGGRAQQKLAVAHAKAAADDPRAVAYLGDFSSRQVVATAPILGRAGILHVAPIASDEKLRSDTLIRLVAGGHVGGATIGNWLLGVGARRSAGRPRLRRRLRRAVGRRHRCGRSRRAASTCACVACGTGTSDPRTTCPARRRVLYVGVAGAGADQLFATLHSIDPELWLLGTEGIAEPWLVEALPDAAAERTRFFVPHRAPFGAVRLRGDGADPRRLHRRRAPRPSSDGRCVAEAAAAGWCNRALHDRVRWAGHRDVIWASRGDRRPARVGHLSLRVAARLPTLQSRIPTQVLPSPCPGNAIHLR